MAKLPTLEVQVDTTQLVKVVKLLQGLADATNRAGAIVEAAVEVMLTAIEEMKKEEDSMNQPDEMIPKEWACSTCGEPATHAVRDELLQPSQPGDTMDRYEVGPLRFGCAKHPETSEVIKPEGSE